MIWKLFAIIFGGIGAILLLIALVFGSSTQLFISQASVADGTVIAAASPDSTRKSVATISFTTSSGQEVQFNSPVSSSPPEFRLGQKVKVYYNPSDPAGSARPDSFLSLWFFSMLSGILALAFCGVGFGFFIVWFLNWKKRKWLQSNGERVTAQVTNIRLNTSVRNMGKSPYVVLAQWNDPFKNMTYTFKSDHIWADPLPFGPGDEVTVLIDPKNYSRYYVEVQPERYKASFKESGSAQL